VSKRGPKSDLKSDPKEVQKGVEKEVKKRSKRGSKRGPKEVQKEAKNSPFPDMPKSDLKMTILLGVNRGFRGQIMLFSGMFEKGSKRGSKSDLSGDDQK